ncbi:hypothetical protein QBC39DRAFT_334886 [Podospora conica]|nr:hypothetical protein QBC39DRAFT_334886 [Schizothecium conicum]
MTKLEKSLDCYDAWRKGVIGHRTQVICSPKTNPLDNQVWLDTRHGHRPQEIIDQSFIRTLDTSTTRQHDIDLPTDPASDHALPSTEDDIDPTFSFTGSATSGVNTPTGDSLFASGVPPRLQNHSSSFASTDSASSTASSPGTISSDLPFGSDRPAELSESWATLQPPASGPARSPSPFISNAHRALMGGETNRSSSPLKRPASSMEPEQETQGEDVDMIVAPAGGPQDSSQSTVQGDVVEIPVADMTAELPLRNDNPPLDQQVKTIETLIQAFAEQPLKEGDVAYLVSRKWLARAQSFGLDAKHASKEVPEGFLGAVDNSDLIQTIFTDSLNQHCVKLKPGLGTEHFELFPKDAWDLLMTWYGLAPGQAPICRKAHNTAIDMVSPPNVQFEFHPPVFSIHRLWSATSPIPIQQSLKLNNPSPPVIMQSTSASYHDFLKKAKQLVEVSMDRKVRVWRRLEALPTTESAAQPSSGIKTPPDSPTQNPEISVAPLTPGAWPEMLVDVETFLKLERDVDRGLVDAEDTTTNVNYNGKKSLSLVGLTVDETLILDEAVDRDRFVSTYKGGTLTSKALETRGNSTSLAPPANNSGRSTPTPLTRGRARKSGRTIGCCGLQNLGNTCYMNSALQCVRAVEELTKYFLTHEAQKEINPENPLSHNGEVAMAYGRLLEDIYKDPPPNSVHPRQFKGVIGKYAPAFQGYGQQDSQEFVGFLLDGLQEDLNRIKKKPYIEKPDSTDDMIGNPAAIREMAEKVWDITKKRDDSVIADLFTGMYKSTLVCPECDKVSITFDPFNNLTLPLPIASVWNKNVRYFPLNSPPVEIVVDIDKHSSIRQLKQYISARVGVPVERLIGAEEFRDRFFKMYEDGMTVSEEITASDNPVIHELEACPTNPVGLKNQKKGPRYKSMLLSDAEAEEPPSWEDPLAERLVVPVLHREEAARRVRGNRNNKTSHDLPPPHFIVLTQAEARSEDIIRRKILEKVATYSTWSAFSQDETDGSETTDPELLNNASDAESSSESKVIAKSIGSEEDMVDVTMSNGAAPQKSDAPTLAAKYPHLLQEFKTRRPKWINPCEFLNPDFQNLFELSYFQESGVSVPTGWQTVSEESIHPRLSTRAPKPVVEDVEMRSPGVWDGSEDSGSEGSPSQDQAHIQTRMASESSEDDSDIPNLRAQVGPRWKNKRSGKTYSKKAKRRFEKQKRATLAQQSNSPTFFDNDTPDDGPLVRLGEGIVVDWNEEAYDFVFGGDSRDEMRGSKTYIGDLPVLEDPTVAIRKTQRQMRQKNGITLDDCLDEFEKEEILSEQDTWYCPRCKEHRRASKKFDLWKSPDILVVHLKRFSSSGYRRDKLDVLVDFPVEGLDLTQRVIDKGDGKQEIYDLIGVDNHYGGLGGGHYTAFAKSFMDGDWYEYNDAHTYRLSDPQKVVSSSAYLLFYRRRSELPLGGPRFVDIVDRFNSKFNNSEEDTDSGEGQRLGQGSSSLRGSPSASTGADLIHRPESRGLVSALSGLATANDDTELPAYGPAAYQDGGDVDTEMGWVQQSTMRNSIEADVEDEGVHLPSYELAGPMASLTSVIPTTGWSFAALDKKAQSEADDDIASNEAQGNGSSVDGNNSDPFADDGDDIAPILLNEEGAQYAGQDEFSAFHDLPPVSPEAQRAYMGEIAVSNWENQVHKVPANLDDDDEASEQVAEIHVDEPEKPQQRPQTD